MNLKLGAADQVIVRVIAETPYFATAERGSRNVTLESELVSDGSPEFVWRRNRTFG
jgi:hypothetical protein